LEPERIHAHCPQNHRDKLGRLHIHHRIDSTNSWLMKQAAQGSPSGTVCVAEQQTAGKGRHGRVWVSPYGRNIYLSLLWRFPLAPVELAGLSLASGIAVLRSLQQSGCSDAGLKWPNDILWQGRKLAGLLLEVAGEAAGPSHVVIGVGLNLAMGKAGDAIDQPWIDLESIPGIPPVSRNRLVGLLLSHLLDVIHDYQRNGLAGFIDEWNRADLLKGEEVMVRSADRVYQGKHLGIDGSGGIRLNIDGESRVFFAGEVSLRSSDGQA
jgi:BirA family biotin operon repressor/biotin-[acetyl-CoA-carboxylase] ligase